MFLRKVHWAIKMCKLCKLFRFARTSWDTFVYFVWQCTRGSKILYTAQYVPIGLYVRSIFFQFQLKKADPPTYWDQGPAGGPIWAKEVVFSFLQCAFFFALFPSVSFRQFLGGPCLVNPTRQYWVTQLYHLGMEDPRPCLVCATPTKLTCGCRKANYCSTQCQKADWHQFLCYAWKFKGCIPRFKDRSEQVN